MNISIRCIGSEDIDDIARLANNYSIAENTANLPYPYTKKHAKLFLDYLHENEQEHVFAICRDSEFVGIIGLVHEEEHKRAELGYWLGQEYWNFGYASAAAGMAIDYAFCTLGINKIYSKCFGGNTASKRVLEKNCFTLEGCLKEHFLRFGKFKDIFCFGLLREQYEKGEATL